MTELTVSERSQLATCEAVIAQGFKTFIEVGNALAEIRDAKLYRLTYGTFEEYCQEKWGMGRNYANRLIAAADVAEDLVPTGTKLPTSERVLRPLANLEPEARREVWRQAETEAPNGKVTQAHVQSAKDDYLHRSQPQRTYDSAIPVVQSPPVDRPKPTPIRPLADNEVEAMIWRGIAHHAKSGTTAHRLEWLQSAEVGDFSRLLNPGVSFEADQLDRIKAKVEAELNKQTRPAQAAANGSKMAVHFSSDNSEHYTPTAIITAAIECMGAIDLDPCSNSKTAPNVPALDHFTLDDDGLSRPWFGRIYMNPPYGRAIPDWVAKLKSEFSAGNTTEAIALVPSRTDTQWWHALRDYPTCLVIGRLIFINNDDPAPFPSAVFYLGKDVAKFSRCFAHLGDTWRRIDV